MEDENANKTTREEKRNSETSSDDPETIAIVEVNTDHDSDTSVGTQGTTEAISAGVSQIGLQKQEKISGAQLRKLRKAKKMAAGQWTQEKPHQKDRGQAKPQESGKKVVKSQEGKNKRPRDDSKTPPQITKRPRSSKKQTGVSYSEIASNLRMAIIDKRHPEVTMDQEQADLVQNKLVEAMDGMPTASDHPLQFAKTTFSGGVLWMTCANEGTREWLKGVVMTLGGLWEGADLTAVESKDLPKRPKVLVFIPGPEEREETVRPRLGRQNPGLRVAGWLLLSRKVEKAGVLLAYSIDEASLGALEKNQFRAFYKLGRVIFRVLGKHDGGPTQGTSGESTAQ